MDSISIAEFRNINNTNRKSSFKKPSHPKRATPEEDLQRACMEWVRYNLVKYPLLEWLMHVPNGGKRSRGEAGKLKAMGVNAGFPDLSIPLQSGKWKGFAAELKSDTGTTSMDQKAWIKRLDEEGWMVEVCRTLDEFIKMITLFLDAK